MQRNILQSVIGMSSKVRLRLLPSPRCLFDDTVQVKVEGLVPKQQVEIRAKLTDDNGVLFRSVATYRAGQNGEIDLSSSPSLGGSYTGVEPMGLFWSLRPESPHAKLRMREVTNPRLVNIEVWNMERPGAMVAKTINERQFMAEGLRRVPVKEGKIRGTLFIPPGRGPFPGILDLYTFGGGLSEIRACLLANKGFLVLTVSLYGYDDLPKNVSTIHLEYFEEALMFLKKQPELGNCGLGVISLSKSGDLALSIASLLPLVSATIWINGCNANTMLPLHYKGTVIPPLMFDAQKAVHTNSGAINVKATIDDPMVEENKGTLIPIERAEGTFLFVAAQDDKNWDSCYFVEQAIKQLRHHGKQNYEVVTYPGAGHYLETPYMPFCPSSMHRVIGQPVIWGGEARAHAAAEVDLWKRIQLFFRSHLVEGRSNRKAQL